MNSTSHPHIPIEFRERVGRLVPQWLSNVVYKIIFLMFRRALIRGTSIPTKNVWYRNSLVFNQTRFMASDIDVSILVKNEAELESTLAGRHLHPLVREIHYYLDCDLALVANLINPFELKRDPLLKKRLMERGLIPADVLNRNLDAEKFIYLLRFLESRWSPDIHLNRNWQRKWRFHFRSVELEKPWSTGAPENPLFALSRLAPEEDRDLVFAALTAYFDWKHGARDNAFPYFCRAPFLQNEYLIALFPHRIGYLTDLPTPTGGFALELYSAQLKWEYWGLLTQLPTIAHDPNFGQHLKNLNHRFSDRVQPRMDARWFNHVSATLASRRPQIQL